MAASMIAASITDKNFFIFSSLFFVSVRTVGFRGALRSLFVANCESIAERGPIDALTGPIERNDAETVVGHLMAFREDPTLLKERDAYTALSRVVVEVAAAKHPERDYSHIAEILRAAR